MKPFLKRLQEYYTQVASSLCSTSNSASIFPNSTDKGQSRERIYMDFLRQHLPCKCEVFAGGFLYGMTGDESGQMDIIVTTDTAPRFHFHNRDGVQKSFAPVDGTLAVFSIKSRLDKKELIQSLKGFVEVPAVQPPVCVFENGRIEIPDHSNWPYKAIVAFDGVEEETLLQHLSSYEFPSREIGLSRAPDLIHVVGKYTLMRGKPWKKRLRTDGSVEEIPIGSDEYQGFSREPDLLGFVNVIEEIQRMSVQAQSIRPLYSTTFNEMFRQILAEELNAQG